MSFYFYDLETSGINARSSRVMQFAGQRVDENFNIVGEPDNFLIKVTPDFLPEPDAILITGITPQSTIEHGITEEEFLEIFNKSISIPDTIFIGFNSIRFDDEFMRFMLYRNFHDAYEWQYKDGKSRWDLLDLVRMTRALRPDGIQWPSDKGKSVNRLELLAKVNKIQHENAHDALSDVMASIGLAKLLHKNQPKLFDYLLKNRDKNSVSKVLDSPQFVYTSGRYPTQFNHTTVATKLAGHPNRQGAIVYDLRHDPTPFLLMTPDQLVDAMKYNPDPEARKLPLKIMLFNRCPAVAPLSVLDKKSQKNIQIDMKKVEQNYKNLIQDTKFARNVLKAIEILDASQEKKYKQVKDVEHMLYDDFITSYDKKIMSHVHKTKPEELSLSRFGFKDKRLTQLFPLYKAKNYPESLSNAERSVYKKYCKSKITEGDPSQAEKYFARLSELEKLHSVDRNSIYLLEELQIYGQNLLLDVDYQG